MTDGNYLWELKFEFPVKFYCCVATPLGIHVRSVVAFVEDVYYLVLRRKSFLSPGLNPWMDLQRVP